MIRNAAFRPASRGSAAGIAAAALCIAWLLPACGPRPITVGSRPFPSERVAVTDASGTPRNDLPPSTEPVRLLLLEYPWCPACRDVWQAIRFAAAPHPAGTVRVYRVLFDRETLLTSSGRRDVPPLRKTPSSGAGGDLEDEGPRITVLTALPEAFRKTFRVRQGPVLFLLDAEGNVERRWIGYSVGMTRELAAEIRKRSRPPFPRPPGT